MPFSVMVLTGPICCIKGGTDFCSGPRDSSLDCVGEMATTNRMIIWVQNVLSEGQYKQ